MSQINITTTASSAVTTPSTSVAALFVDETNTLGIKTSGGAVIPVGTPDQTGQSGKFLTTNGSSASWATVSASPGGSNNQVQFNTLVSVGPDFVNTFGGSANLTFVESGTFSTPTLAIGNGANCALQVGNSFLTSQSLDLILRPGSSAFVELSDAGSKFAVSRLGDTERFSVDRNGVWALMGSSGADGQLVGQVGGVGAWTNAAPVYTLATLPTAVAGQLITVSDANSGAGALCYSDGSTWKDAATHSTVA